MQEEKVIEGGQSICRIKKDEKGGQVFEKELRSKIDYLHEKGIYLFLENCQQQSQQQLNVLQMISFDDYSQTIVFPYIKCSLSFLCSKKDQKSRRGLNWHVAMYHFTKIVKTIIILHKYNLCHCDLKIDNILCEPKITYFRNYVIDFGHSQKLKQNEQSQKLCGTKQYNPTELNEGINSQNIKPYSPYKLDLYQLGMMLLTMMVPFPICENVKKLINSKKKDSFYEAIRAIYKDQNKVSEFEIKFEVYDLIWSLLTGQINEAFEILNHKAYQLPEMIHMLEIMSNHEEINPQKMDIQQITQVGQQQVFTNFSQNANRGSKSLNIKDEFEKKLNKFCVDPSKFTEKLKDFCNKEPRKVDQIETYAYSLLIEYKIKKTMKALLYFLSQNNNNIFNEKIFVKKENLVLEVVQKYKITEIDFEENEEDIDNDESDDYDSSDENKKFKVSQKEKELKMQIEIVSFTDNQSQKEFFSINFKHLKDNKSDSDGSIYFSNIVSDIQENFKDI